MRKMFLTAVALAPLCIAAAAHAETVISSKRTTSIATATANNGAPDSVTIADGGSIAVSSGAAVTVNSNHDVTNHGGIQLDDAADGSTGILVAPGTTADIINDGTISIDDKYTPKDDDEDGDLDGPFAEGNNQRGIWVQGDLTGDLTNTSDGLILIEGNNSVGIQIDGVLNGDLTSEGQIRVTGNNDYGVLINGAVNGDVAIGGQVAVLGQNSVGLMVDGDINGALNISSTMTSTGYRYTQRPSDEQVADLEPDDLLQGGPAVWIASNVTGGVLFDRTPEDLDPNDDDEDNDGILDKDETTAQVTSVGSAPAVRVGSTTTNITLGEVGTGDYAYGFVYRGNATGGGIYDGVEATAIEFGMVGGMDVIINGGVRLSDGLVAASGIEADATGIVFRDGVITPLLSNNAGLSAVMIGDDAHDAIALLIESGAQVSAIYNDESISGSVGGEAGDAYGIVDRSGTVTLVQNTGNISAEIIPTDGESDTDDANTDPSDEQITGSTTAIDLSLNTLGAVVRQMGINDGDDLGDGVADADADGDGVDDNDEPAIVGDVRFGSGADTLDLQNGSMEGDVYFGAGADTMTIDGGASFQGRISDSDQVLAVNVLDGSIEATNTSPVQVSSLNVAADGMLIVTLDPEKAGSELSGFDVSGTATIATGAGLGVRFESLLRNEQDFTIIQAGDLQAGTIDLALLTSNTPYVYQASAVVDTANDALLLHIDQKTTEQMGMILSEADAYAGIYEALMGISSSDPDVLVSSLLIRREFLTRLTQSEFYDLYRQFLPQHSGGPLLSLTAGLDAVRHALSDRRVQADPGEVTSWLQEIDFYTDKNQGQAYGFDAEGFGVAGGIERGGSMGTWGLSFAYTSSDLKDPTSVLEEVTTSQLFEAGVYWRTGGDNWRAWARAAGGYSLLNETREVITPSIVLRYKSDWSGYSFAGGTGASYDMRWRKWYGRAEGALEYFYLSEGAHNEHGNNADLAYRYDGRNGHLLKAEATLNIGRRFGEDGWLTPEIRLGWRQNISSDLGMTTFRIGSGTTRISLRPDAMEGGGPMFGFRLTAGSVMGFLGIEGTAILLEDYDMYSLMLRGGFRF
ncbi:MAG: autotransporter outer membrane beta-barrel domain-containing protein [Caulobacteraceae bacterium]|nr:autotransporter outer membrane beta-barrel domain-containing protein [Caulobacteraceae bacterium]